MSKMTVCGVVGLHSGDSACPELLQALYPVSRTGNHLGLLVRDVLPLCGRWPPEVPGGYCPRLTPLIGDRAEM